MELQRINGHFDNYVVVKNEPVEEVPKVGEEEAGNICHAQQWEEGSSSCTCESTAFLERWSNSAEHSDLKPQAGVTWEAGLKLQYHMKTSVEKLEAGRKLGNDVKSEHDVRPGTSVGPEHGVNQKPVWGQNTENDMRSQNGVDHNCYVRHSKSIIGVESSKWKAAVCNCHSTDSKHNQWDGLSFANDQPPKHSGVMLTDQQDSLTDGDPFRLGKEENVTQIKVEVPSEEEVQRQEEEKEEEKGKRESNVVMRPNAGDCGGQNPRAKEEGHEEEGGQWKTEDSVVIRLNACGDNGSGNVINMHPNDCVLSFSAPSSLYPLSTDKGGTYNQAALLDSSVNGSSRFGLAGPSTDSTNVVVQTGAFEGEADPRVKQGCSFNACADFGTSVGSVEEDCGSYFGRSRPRYSHSLRRSVSGLILMTRDPQRNGVVVCNFNLNTGRIVCRETYTCNTDQQMLGTRNASPKKKLGQKRKADSVSPACLDMDCTTTTATAVAKSTNTGCFKQRSPIRKVRRKWRNSSGHNSSVDTASTVFAKKSAVDSCSTTTALGDPTARDCGCVAEEGKVGGRWKRSKKGTHSASNGDNSSAVSRRIGKTCKSAVIDIPTLGIISNTTTVSTRANPTVSRHVGRADNTAITRRAAVSVYNDSSMGSVHHSTGSAASTIADNNHLGLDCSSTAVGGAAENSGYPTSGMDNITGNTDKTVPANRTGKVTVNAPNKFTMNTNNIAVSDNEVLLSTNTSTDKNVTTSGRNNNITRSGKNITTTDKNVTPSRPEPGQSVAATDTEPSTPRPVRLLYKDVAVRSSSGKTMFKCPQCGQIFGVISFFNRHFVRQHPSQVC